MNAILLFLSLFFFSSSYALNCDDIKRSDLWLDIFAECTEHPRLLASEHVVLDLSIQDEKDINMFFAKKTHLGVGIIIHKSGIKNLILRSLREISLTFANGIFEVSDCPFLESIDVDNVETIKMGFGGKLFISNNHKLLTFHSHALSFVDLPICEFSGNRYLEFNYLPYKFRTCVNKPGSYIQNQQECRFEEAIESAEELVGCKYVYGDVLFKKGAIGDAGDSRTDEIHGCVHMHQTNVTSLSFLYKARIHCKTRSLISENALLRDCNEIARIPSLTALVDKKKMILENNCELVCVGQKKMLHSGRQCLWSTGDLRLIDDKSAHGYKNLMQMRELNGSLEISQTHIMNMDFLPNLESIISLHPETPAINISFNHDLEKINLGNLKKIVSAADIKVVIQGNGNYTVPDDLYRQLVKIVTKRSIRVDRKKVDVEKEKVEERTWKEKQKIKEEKEKKEREEEEKKKKEEQEREEEEERERTERNIIIGSVIGGIAFIALAAVITAVVVVIVKKRRKAKVSPSQMKNPEDNSAITNVTKEDGQSSVASVVPESKATSTNV